jgi:hypothetical protein
MKCSRFNFSNSTPKKCTGIPRGFDWRVSITRKDKEKAPLNLTGYTNKVIIKDMSGATIFTLIDVLDFSENGIYTPDVATGQMYIIIKKESTGTMADSQYKYEWESVEPDGFSRLFMFGEINVYQGAF